MTIAIMMPRHPAGETPLPLERARSDSAIGMTPLSADPNHIPATNLPDFRYLYASSNRMSRGSSRSLSSFTTDWSTSTDVASNTTTTQQEKKNRKRRFMRFTTVLMKFLERKDRNVFGEAQAVLRDCEKKKMEGKVGFESVTESARKPLKEVVGPSYWKEVREHLKHADELSSSSSSSQQHENAGREEQRTAQPLNVPCDETVSSSSTCSSSSSSSLSHADLVNLERSMCARHPSPLSTRTCGSVEDEHRLRRERFWMLIRVLMKYLEQKDHDLYLRAKETIQDCVKRNKHREKGFRSLSACVLKSVKDMVGKTYWRRAETYLTRVLVRKANDEADEAMRLRFHMEQARYHPYHLSNDNNNNNNNTATNMMTPYPCAAKQRNDVSTASIFRPENKNIPSKRPCKNEPDSIRNDIDTVAEEENQESACTTSTYFQGKRRRF